MAKIQDVMAEIDGKINILCLVNRPECFNTIIEKHPDAQLFYPYGEDYENDKVIFSHQVPMGIRLNKIIFTANHRKDAESLSNCGAVLERYEDKYT